ncbi:MAG: CotH kinase family protein [Verrucomicrobia bacterium]|nr:CotH kinase family protein [Verrucomicrobiota bacterium]
MKEPRTPVPRRRRAARWLIWTTLAVVVFLRLHVFHPEPQPVPFFRQPRGGDEWRWHRPPTIVHPPVTPVPADLYRLQIEIAGKDESKLRAASPQMDARRRERPEVLATVREGGQVFTNVALHLKGAAGSFRPLDDKPALTLNFAKHAHGQRFHGYSKISLNNSVQDSSFLCEAISRELFDAAGVPVPRAEHATVVINGRDLGLYVLLEGYNKDFLRRYFKNVKGNLYDGGFCQDIDSRLNTNSGDAPDDRSDLRRLAGAAREPDAAKRWNRLNEVLDVERFISLLAMEIMTCHWDGYAMNRNNYRVFHDLETDRMIFMPHGMDQMFGTFRSNPQSTIHPGMNGLVAEAVISTPQGRQRYLERIATLRTNVFDEAVLIKRVHQLSAWIRPTLAAYGPEVAREHDNQVADLCARITERAQSIAEQLSGPKQTLRFDDNGEAELTNWKPRGSQNGPPTSELRRVETAGQKLLHIGGDRRSGSPSWRTRVLLEPGRYQVAGRARTSGAGPGAVCLRISGSRPRATSAEGSDWVSIKFGFDIREPRTEVELVCEFRSQQGEAWFDADSLRLLRTNKQ